MELHERARDRESQPESALPSIEAALPLNEDVEHARYEVGGHPNARVATLDDDVVVLLVHAQQDVRAGLGYLAAFESRLDSTCAILSRSA